ncbi:MAG: peptidoglycan DD-metalloendopeptidase family protein [Oscillospiraceae bacterium]|nr:peptidoglycan DD-metalloendopeptidase family protein [Oscillospiraceae bacterium]
MSRRLVRIIAIMLAVLMVFGVLASLMSYSASAAPTRDQLNELKEKHSDLKQQMQETKSKINSLEFEQLEASKRKELLDQQIDLKLQEIDNINERIAVLDALIEEKTAEAREYQRRENVQREIYRTRIRAMEENGVISYLQIVFGASDFADMLFRIDAVNEIMRRDQGIYDALVAAEDATNAAKAEIVSTRGEAAEVKAELETAKAELAEQEKEAEALIAELQKNIEEYTEYYEAQQREREQIYKDIIEMEEELKKLEMVKGTGVFMWPAQYKGRITSKFGWRIHPVLGTSKYHSGIDIGGQGYGAEIYAADSGTVVTSAKSDTYGNYVVINHGNGYTTLYAHMQSRNVKTGDKVTKGDVIGWVGSTGLSNGPHLHFEIWDNGTRIDPAKFYSNLEYASDA